MLKKKARTVKSRHYGFLCSILLLAILTLLMLPSCDLTPEATSGKYIIKGRVTQTVDGKTVGVKDVTISAEDTNRSTETDAEGYYQLDKIPGRHITLKAQKGSLILIPDFSSISEFAGYAINVIDSADKAVVEGANFTASDYITIALIQGTGYMSPVEGLEVNGIEGVVTAVHQTKPHYKFRSSTFDEKNDRDIPDSGVPQMVGEDGFYMEMRTPDGNPLTSDGIFVSTRDPKGYQYESAWLDSCMVVDEITGKTRYPQPGDIVKVSGTVVEDRPVNRFNEGLDNMTRTQINATTITYEGEHQDIGDGVLITFQDAPARKDGTAYGKDEFRTLNFNGTGIEDISKASLLFESVEGMLVKVNDPIVTGGTYYNFTGVMPDGGKKDGSYPTPFNEKWLAPVLRKNDFNADQIHVYWDNGENANIDTTVSKPAKANSLGKLPQLGTVLAEDGYNTYDPANPPALRGVMDYVDEGNYIIYALRNEANAYVKFQPHKDYNFVVNPESFYAKNGISELALNDQPAADLQPWIYSTEQASEFGFDLKLGTYNPLFSAPWEMTPIGSNDTNMTVAVFNLENYINKGSIPMTYPEGRYPKADNVARAIIKALKCPDIIYIVEMGDDDDSGDLMHYQNQNHSWLAPTGIVSARDNYHGLIETIEELSGGYKYDYRQIDPIEFDQAGSPGNNIRVGFLFRTDRIKAHDIGLETHHYDPDMEFTSEDLIDKEGRVESALTNLAKANANLIKADDNTPLTLTQSPGFIQNGAFYHSRIPLICQFTFLPDDAENSQDFFAIAAHLYAKGPDAPLYGEQQPPVFTSEIRRGNQALALNNFIKEMQSLEPDAKIIVAGDMNDFGFSPAIKKLTGEYQNNQILYSLSEEFMPEEERFSYYYRGNLQELDHIFVTENIFKKNGGNPNAGSNGNVMAGDTWMNKVFIPHIDSIFTRNNHVQISDHDPVVARIDMSK